VSHSRIWGLGAQKNNVLPYFKGAEVYGWKTPGGTPWGKPFPPSFPPKKKLLTPHNKGVEKTPLLKHFTPQRAPA